MRDSLKPIPMIRLVSAAILLWTAGCRENEFVPPPPPTVTVATPQVRDVVEYADLTGRTAPFQEVEVRARVEGILLESLYEEGQRVTEGDVLFRIDPAPFIAQRDAAAAQVQRAEAELELAEVTADRVERSARDGAVSELQALESRAKAKAAAAQLEVARRELAIRQLSVDYTEVHATLTGQIESGAPAIGSLVGPGSDSLLTRIYDTTRVYAWLTLSDRLLLLASNRADGQSRPELEVLLATEIDDGYPFRGTIDYIDPVVDTDTGTVRVRGVFDNADGRLKAGLFVRGRIAVRMLEDALLVPETAIGTGQAGKYVLIVNAENVVEVRPVTLGPAEGPMRVIRTGLTGGERVVVSALLRARPGSKVVPEEARPAAAGRADGVREAGSSPE